MENIKIQEPVILDKIKKKRVSYSKFSVWFKCPHHFYLDDVKGLKTFEDTINTCFGTAIHESIQLYISTLYKENVKAADAHDLQEIFKISFDRELKERNVKYTEDEYMEFFYQSDDIIKSFTNFTNRIKYFPSGKYELIGIEDEIVMPIKNNVDFICYIDVVLKDKVNGRYRIIDLKTSSNGWNQWQKEDLAKYSQILLYKAFFGKKYNVPADMIDVEFFILKRTLYKNVSYPQSHIQTFIPKHNQKSIISVLQIFSQFVGDCFKEDGTFNEDREKYPKIPGKAKKHCKYCPHKKINCDMKSDIPLDEME